MRLRARVRARARARVGFRGRVRVQVRVTAGRGQLDDDGATPLGSAAYLPFGARPSRQAGRRGGGGGRGDEDCAARRRDRVAVYLPHPARVAVYLPCGGVGGDTGLPLLAGAKLQLLSPARAVRRVDERHECLVT